MYGMNAYKHINELMNRVDYILLFHIMQHLESILMIEVISRRIAAEKPHLPFFTVHDSIATFSEEVPYIKQVIKEEFKRYLDIVAIIVVIASAIAGTWVYGKFRDQLPH